MDDQVRTRVRAAMKQATDAGKGLTKADVAQMIRTEEANVEPATVAQVKRPNQSAPRSEPTPEPEVATLTASGNPVEAEDVATLFIESHRRPALTGPEERRLVEKRWTPAFQASSKDDVVAVSEAVDAFEKQARAELFDGAPIQAAAGICGPLTPKYEPLSISQADRLLMLPEVGVEETGGLRIPAGISPNDLNDEEGIGYPYTSVDAEGGSRMKPTVEYACPVVSDQIVTAYATRIVASNFAERFNREGLNAFIQAAMSLHAHRVNRAEITEILADGNTVTFVAADTEGGATVQIAREALFHAGLMRERYMLPSSMVLDFVLPYQVYGILAADLAMRQSTTASDADVADYLTTLSRTAGIRISFVDDWPELGHEDSAGGFDDTLQDALLIPPGAIVRMDGGILEIGEVRDSVYNAENQVEIFVETFTGLSFMGHDSFLLTGIYACPDGEVGLGVASSCVGTGS